MIPYCIIRISVITVMQNELFDNVLIVREHILNHLGICYNACHISRRWLTSMTCFLKRFAIPYQSGAGLHHQTQMMQNTSSSCVLLGPDLWLTHFKCNWTPHKARSEKFISLISLSFQMQRCCNYHKNTDLKSCYTFARGLLCFVALKWLCASQW